MQNTNRSNRLFILSMFIFGTIGIFVRSVQVPSSILACARGFIGGLFLIAFMIATRKPFHTSAVAKKLILLILSGIAIGINWIALFESYRYTSVAISTLCYYMAPVFVLALSPIILKEKLSIKKVICIIMALIGMIFVSGLMTEGIPEGNHLTGILFGLTAAVFYATVMMINRFLKEVPAYEKTIVQLLSAAVVVLPYILMTNAAALAVWNTKTYILIIVVGIVHTGITYLLYFDAMGNMKAANIAIFSYIDPVVAILLSALLLSESMDIFGIIGSVLIIGAALMGDLL